MSVLARYNFLLLYLMFFLFVTSSCFFVDDDRDSQNFVSKSSGHKNFFPEKLVIFNSFNSEIPIEKIKIFYSISGSEVTNYGYPVFTPSTEVATEYIINTSGNDFLPAGVVIDYYYEITDIENNVIVSQSNELEYLDDDFDWKRVTGKGLEIVHHGLSQDQSINLHDKVSKRISPIKKTFLDDQNSFDIKGVLFDSRKESSKAFQYLSDSATKNHLFGGFAYPDYDLFLVSGYNPDVIVHEITHLIIGEAMGSRRAVLPKWLNEGLAMYYQNNGNSWRKESKNFVKRAKIMTLNKMNSLPGKASDVGLFYRKSESVVGYLISKYGIEKIGVLIKYLKTQGDFDSNFYKTYGITIDELEKNWSELILLE